MPETGNLVDVVGNSSDEVILREVEELELRAVIEDFREISGNQIQCQVEQSEVFQVADSCRNRHVYVLFAEQNSDDSAVGGALDLRPIARRGRGVPRRDRRRIPPLLSEVEQDRPLGVPGLRNYRQGQGDKEEEDERE